MKSTMEALIRMDKEQKAKGWWNRFKSQYWGEIVFALGLAIIGAGLIGIMALWTSGCNFN